MSDKSGAVQMRLLAVVGVLTGTAHAGTVDSVTFDGSAPGQIVIANGVEARSLGGFVVYRHSVWTPKTTGTSAGPAIAAVGAEAATTTVCTSRVAISSPSLAAATVAYRMAYWPLVREAECRHGLPLGLLDAVVLQESRYRPWGMSSAGAAGLTQLMPRTAGELGVVDRFDPKANIDGGARYLKSMLDHYRSVPLALAAYNAGRGAVDRWGGIPLNHETPGYVRKVLGYFNDLSSTAETNAPALLAHVVSLSFESADQDRQ